MTASKDAPGSAAGSGGDADPRPRPATRLRRRYLPPRRPLGVDGFPICYVITYQTLKPCARHRRRATFLRVHRRTGRTSARSAFVRLGAASGGLDLIARGDGRRISVRCAEWNSNRSSAVTRTAKTSGDHRDWVKKVEDICEANALQLTPLRRQVLELISRAKAPLGAYAVIDQLSQSRAKSVAPPTAYRALDFLVDHGFVVKIASTNAYAPCDHLGHHHHGMLLICNRCGRADEIENPKLDAVLAETAARIGFRPQRQVVEIEGLCGACGEAVAAPQALPNG
nr:Fur family transcriptional regulator [Rhodoblastus sphagnicola]